MVMNQHSIVFYHSDNAFCKDIYNICTNTKMHLFECQKIDVLAYIMEKIKPMYVVFDTSVNFNTNIFNDFERNNKSCYIYLIGKKYLNFCNEHVFVVDNYKMLENAIGNHFRCFSNQFFNFDITESKCYAIIHNALNTLCFKSKYIGFKYIGDLIYELYTNSSISNGKCNDTYNKLAKRYNTNSCNIEKSIRFCIQRAFENCQEKALFFNISKTSRIPSIKELANFILDKLYLSCISDTTKINA